MEKKKRICCYIRVNEDYARLEDFSAYDEKYRCDDSVEYAGLFADAYYRNYWVRIVKKAEAGELDKIIVSCMEDLGDTKDEQIKEILKVDKAGTEIYFDHEQFSSYKAGVIATLKKSVDMIVELKAERKDMTNFKLARFNTDGEMYLLAPFGYDMHPDETITINDAEAEAVKKIFKLYLKGYGLNKIAVELEKQGIKTKTKESAWYATTVKNVLQNSRYTEGISDLRFKPIIDAGTFESVQKKMAQKSKAPAKSKLSKRKKNPLAGKVYCARCGKKYYCHNIKERSGSGSWKCTGRQKYGSEYCNSTAFSDKCFKQLLVKSFNEYVDERLKRGEALHVTDKYETVKAQREELKRMLSDNYITKEQYQEHDKALRKEIEYRKELANAAGFKVPGISEESKSTTYDDHMVDFLISASIAKNEVSFIFDGGIEKVKRINKDR